MELELPELKDRSNTSTLAPGLNAIGVHRQLADSLATVDGSSQAWLQTVAVVIYACLRRTDASTVSLGRATFYGAGDGFTLNDGSCACHKQDVKSGWLSSRCESGFCFDYIGEQSL